DIVIEVIVIITEVVIFFVVIIVAAIVFVTIIQVFIFWIIVVVIDHIVVIIRIGQEGVNLPPLLLRPVFLILGFTNRCFVDRFEWVPSPQAPGIVTKGNKTAVDIQISVELSEAFPDFLITLAQVLLNFVSQVN